MSWKVTDELNRIRRSTDHSVRSKNDGPGNDDDNSPRGFTSAGRTRYGSREDPLSKSVYGSSYGSNGRSSDEPLRQSRESDLGSKRSDYSGAGALSRSMFDDLHRRLDPGDEFARDRPSVGGNPYRRSRSRSPFRDNSSSRGSYAIGNASASSRGEPGSFIPIPSGDKTTAMEGHSRTPGIIKEVSLSSGAAVKFHSQFERTLLRPQMELFRDFVLLKICSLENRELEERFEAKQMELQTLANSIGCGPDEVSVSMQYGFLATINLQLMERVANEGLATTMCPINILGHCVSGVHLCFHGDVCLRQAAEEAPHSKNIVLVMFKFIYGRKHRVATSDGFFLLAPTPNMHSHISREPATAEMPLAEQHKRSLVYLYEFKNQFFHPITRPRLCCPVAALIFQRNPTMTTSSGLPAAALTETSTSGKMQSYPMSSNPNSMSSVLNSIGMAAHGATSSGGGILQPPTGMSAMFPILQSKPIDESVNKSKSHSTYVPSNAPGVGSKPSGGFDKWRK